MQGARQVAMQWSTGCREALLTRIGMSVVQRVVRVISAQGLEGTVRLS